MTAHDQFRADMAAAGFDIDDYRGRFFYDGPAVRTNEDGIPTLQDVIRASTVTVQWDNLGYDWIVYPV